MVWKITQLASGEVSFSAFSCSTGSFSAITPSLQNASQSVTLLNDSTLLVAAVTRRRSDGSEMNRSSTVATPGPPRGRPGRCTGRRGRPRLKGARLGAPADLAASTAFTTEQVKRYGRTDQVRIAEVRRLWYGSFHTQTDRMILIPMTARTPATAWRWSIEGTFAEARTLLGVGQARSRTEHAVRRTVPFGLYCYSITVVWYTLHGHHPNDAADRRGQAPWYTTKADPAFADILAKLRRVIIATRFLPAAADRPTNAEIRAVQQAWAQAGLDHAA